MTKEEAKLGSFSKGESCFQKGEATHQIWNQIGRAEVKEKGDRF